jgi:hypothetical protein
MAKNIVFDTSSSSGSYVVSTNPTSNAPVGTKFWMIETGHHRLSRSGHSESNVESAIYAHIKAIRSLGKHTINTEEIATALSLPVSVVNRAISGLRSKGVKAVR